MGQTPHQIESDIRKTRAELHSNFQELEEKVKSVTDWKQQFENHPGSMAAAAFGVGALLAVMVGGQRRTLSVPNSSANSTSPADSKPSRQKHQALQHVDNIKSALVGVAATKVTEYLGQLLPGFEGELRKAASNRNSHAAIQNPMDIEGR